MPQLQEDIEAQPSYEVRFRDGGRRQSGPHSPSFVLSLSDEAALQHVLGLDSAAAANAFVNGEFEISGDMMAAVRMWRGRPPHRTPLHNLLGRTAAWLEHHLQSRAQAASNIRFHYDRSNEFYREFLDSRMVYSCANFENPVWPLEKAQEAKLILICSKLDLRPDDTFLDVGCGWGALILHAAGQCGARATGCTLSRSQYEYVTSAVEARGLGKRITVLESDYRDLSGRFRKISSIGMFEHVGRARLAGYFRKIHSLLEEGGLFLNSGITRPQTVGDDTETEFLRTQVFPGGELAHISDIARDAENAGFEVVEADSIRKDYARTCREWVGRLFSNRAACIALAGEKVWRIWLLYLAASAVNFEESETDAYQILMARR